MPTKLEVHLKTSLKSNSTSTTRTLRQGSCLSPGRNAWLRNFDLDQLVSDNQVNDTQMLFGSQGASAIYKRGSAILKFLRWYRVPVKPLSDLGDLECFSHLEQAHAPASLEDSWNVVVNNNRPTLQLPKQRQRRVELRELAREERRASNGSS